MGQMGRRLGIRPLARLPYQAAVALCRAEGDPLLLAHTVRHLGDVHQDAGRIALAEPCYREALRLYRGNPATRALDLANALRPLAILVDGAGDAEEARRLFAEARDLYAAARVDEGVADCDHHLARLGTAR
jgi:tetratricopeptide (TPR) repeat protein